MTEKNYTAVINNNEKLQISPKQIAALNIQPLSKNTFHILKNNKSYQAKITHTDFAKKTYTIVVKNKPYTITIKNALDALIEQMGFATSNNNTVKDIKAPMPGLLLDIAVKQGQEVKENDMLCILEAMKMENVIKAPCACKIKSIAVKKGEAVEKNQLLIAFE